MKTKRVSEKKGRPARGPSRGANLVQLWQQAVFDLENQHFEQMRTARPDKIRFQNDCLFDALQKRIHASSHEPNATLYECYMLAVAPNGLGGMTAARRLYWGEVHALQKVERVEWPGIKDTSAVLEQIRSFCSWFEAERSLDAWLAFNHNRAAWTGSDDERWQAIQAEALAELPKRIIECESAGRTARGAKLWAGSGLGADLSGQPWKPGPWANIMERAARLALKDTSKCSPLEQWMWWCYPVFRRHKWNAHQVIATAIDRGFSEPLVDKDPREFARHWITRGLRFSGGKQSKSKSPKLTQFVRQLVVPDPKTIRGVPIWKWWG
ncbi:MAG TPA: hypothetical protein VGI60_02750 [Chthoniobacterales bacterium]|jgi:hypothetical protein